MIKHNRVFFCLAAIAVLVANLNADAADRITRKSSNRRIAGKIESFTRNAITIKVGIRNAKEEKIPVGDILKVEWDGEPKILNSARNAEAGGRLKFALGNYKKTHDAIADASSRLKTDLSFLLARVAAKQAQTDATQLEDAIKQLNGFRALNPQHFRYYETSYYLGLCYRKKNDAVNAKKYFEELKNVDGFAEMANLGLTQSLIASGEAQKALGLLDRAIQSDAGSPKDKMQAQLGRGMALQALNQHQKAVDQFDEIVATKEFQTSGLEAETYLRQGLSYRTLGKSKQALLAFLHVDLLYFSESERHAEALYYLVEQWNDLGEPDRSNNARSKLLSSYPKSEWVGKLNTSSNE